MSWTNATAWGISSVPADDWRKLASCRDYDPELWHPVGDGQPARQQIHEAKAICRRCPVIDECFDASLANGFEFGVWAGLTEEERRSGHRPQPVSLMAWLNASKTHCPQAHLYTPENTHLDKRGRRHCLTCARVRVSARRHREVARS